MALDVNFLESMTNNFPRLKAWEIIRIWTKRK